MTRPWALDECQDVVEAVTDYLVGALPPDEAATLRAHLAECEDCATYVAQVRRVCGDLEHLPDGPADRLPPALVDALTERFSARHPRRP
ncbi:anti-sigma factor family protein [Aquipuribacter nitratireducens]|uniref:Anti-sigma factor family protein n=1 Tax=Aquipuribacter nitratireducens TaxID=650104 RepID=A0ABW0GHY5_9MICO